MTWSSSNTSTVSDNEAAGDGGGIFARTTIQFNRHSSFQFIHGTATLKSSTVSGNVSGGKGGGLNARFVNLDTSTVSGNTAVTGGGIYSHKDATIGSSTITGNKALAGVGGGLWNGDPEILAGQFPITSTININRTILAGNTATGGSPDLRPGGGSLLVVSSLIGDNAGSTLEEAQSLNGSGNLIGSAAGSGVINPRLAPLADNGGSTQTHALLTGSPALDAIAYSDSGPTPDHEYRLDNSRADTFGGPNIFQGGGTLLPTGVHFGPSEGGLLLGSALASLEQYSLEIFFEWEALSGGWQKILDFRNRSSNVGLYTANDGLHFTNGPFVAGLFAPNEMRRLVLTRESTTNIVRAYIDGVQVWNFVDSARQAVFSNNSIYFFWDDSVTGPIEAQSGFVDYIRVFNTVLTPAQVVSLSGPEPHAYDQRGEPFLRARDGDGDGSRYIDMGSFELIEPSKDHGDAPDSGAGTGSGNYNTTASDNGPRHTIVPGLHIGANVDADSSLLQNNAANADDVEGALPDDEDGVTNPAADLVLTVGAQPTVNLRATNTTGAAATLYGWIDYNANGVFDNAMERASVAVPNGTNNGIFTLVFPAVPSGFTGTTFARFRLGTDPAAANPIGPAANGEVEDHRTTIVRPTEPIPNSSKTKLLMSGTNGVPNIPLSGYFAHSVANIGDLDGDGTTDLAVGDTWDDTGGGNAGAFYIFFMNPNGTVRNSQKIASNTGGGPPLNRLDSFGRTVTSLGDLDGDGVPDLAVGTANYNGRFPGGVYVLFMNRSGTVKNYQLIASGVGGGPNLGLSDQFGYSVVSLGDLDGDGVSDMAAGAVSDGLGAIYVLFMNPNGTAKSFQKIAPNIGAGPAVARDDGFGRELASLGDINGDGVTDLAMGSPGDDTGGDFTGATYILFLAPNGVVKSSQKIAAGIGGAPPLRPSSGFGGSVASLGDLDGDGVTDLAVGAIQDNAVHVLLLNTNGTVKRFHKIAEGTRSVSSLGDLDGDGLTDLAVGVRLNTSQDRPGALYVLFLSSPALIDYGDAPDSGVGTGPGNYNTTTSDNGPRHTIVPGLRIGAVVDADSGSLQNGAANADDVNAALPDDEDGVSNPAADLVLTVGANQGAGGFTLFDVPGYLQTVPNGINDLGQIVGAVHNVGEGHGFFKDGNTITTLGYPDAQFSHFTGINDFGVIAGNTSSASSGVSYGFVKNGQEFTQFRAPGSEVTSAYGINNLGQVVGDYRRPLPAHTRGFIKDGSAYTLLDVPFAGAITTEPRGINNDGIVVGFFAMPTQTDTDLLRTVASIRNSTSLARITRIRMMSMMLV